MMGLRLHKIGCRFCGCGCAWYSEEGLEARLLWSLASYVANSHNASQISTNTRATLKEALKRSKPVLLIRQAMSPVHST
jgi:predicted small metal-binding protein